jgi:hypothetical protein
MGTDPYEELTDEQVLERATRALKMVQEHPVGSTARSMQWAVYENAKAELDMRFMGHVLRKLRERRERGEH